METFITVTFGLLLFAAGLLVLTLALWIAHLIGLLFSGLYLLLHSVLGLLLLPFGVDILSGETTDGS